MPATLVGVRTGAGRRPAACRRARGPLRPGAGQRDHREGRGHHRHPRTGQLVDQVLQSGVVADHHHRRVPVVEPLHDVEELRRGGGVHPLVAGSPAARRARPTRAPTSAGADGGRHDGEVDGGRRSRPATGRPRAPASGRGSPAGGGRRARCRTSRTWRAAGGSGCARSWAHCLAVIRWPDARRHARRVHVRAADAGGVPRPVGRDLRGADRRRGRRRAPDLRASWPTAAPGSSARWRGPASARATGSRRCAPTAT